MFGGSSRKARRPFNLSGAQERRAPPERSDAMTGNLPADQGRAPQLYDEQLQRQQQEKRLMQGREARVDLLQPTGARP